MSTEDERWRDVDRELGDLAEREQRQGRNEEKRRGRLTAEASAAAVVTSLAAGIALLISGSSAGAIGALGAAVSLIGAAGGFAISYYTDRLQETTERLQKATEEEPVRPHRLFLRLRFSAVEPEDLVGEPLGGLPEERLKNRRALVAALDDQTLVVTGNGRASVGDL